MQHGFRFDQRACVGCHACTVSCKIAHHVPQGKVRWRSVHTIRGGTFAKPLLEFFATACYHCTRPACVEACPMGAISKRAEDGIVVVDRELCIGHDRCDSCLQSCPFEAPQFGPEPNAKMQMCNYCIDRLEEGRRPVCVEMCPVDALDAGPLDELMKKYGDGKKALGFTWSDKVGPAAVIESSQG